MPECTLPAARIPAQIRNHQLRDLYTSIIDCERCIALKTNNTHGAPTEATSTFQA